MRLPPCLLNSEAELRMELLEIISRPRLSLNGHSVLLNLTAPRILTPVPATQLHWSLLNNITYNIILSGTPAMAGLRHGKLIQKYFSSEIKIIFQNLREKEKKGQGFK